MAEPARPAGFDMGRLSTASKLLLAVGLLLFIDLFLPWDQVCSPGVPELGIEASCATTAIGWEGIGIIAGLLLVALLAWEIASALGANINVGTTSPAVISAALAAGVVLFTLIHALTRLGGVDDPAYGTWIGIILALVLAYGAYMRWQEARMGGTAAPGRPMAPPAP